MPKVPPWEDNEYRLCENRNFGTLRYLKPGALKGPWRLVPGDEQEAVLARERRRRDACNEWIGHLRGKTIVLLGAGPQLRRLTPGICAHIAKRPDLIVAGVNSVPAILRHIIGYDPTSLFRFVFGPDYTQLRWKKPGSEKAWGWEDLDDSTLRVIAAGIWNETWWSVKHMSGASVCLPDLYWGGCMAGALNMALLALSDPKPSKNCWGPRCDWPAVHADMATGQRIVLVGVEHNNHQHAFTGHAKFKTLQGPDYQERLEQGELKDDWRQSGYSIMAKQTHATGCRVVNTAPWSLIRSYEFGDFEDELDIPQDLRVGVTARGKPEA